REGEGVEQRRRYRPGDVEVVAREEESVHDPVAASGGAVHPRQQVAAEQQLLAEHGGEDEQGKDKAVPAPCGVEERLPRVRLATSQASAAMGSAAAAQTAKIPRRTSLISFMIIWALLLVLVLALMVMPIV